ncbi:MAG TPA: helix-turn-helix domain-containing protein [Solirubrobacteraceae bacterium]
MAPTATGLARRANAVPIYSSPNSLAVSGRSGSLTGMRGTEPTSAAVVESILAEGPLLCPHEAAALLSVKPSWVFESVRAHRIPCLRVGRHIRFTRAMLEQWLAEQVDG